MNRPNQPAASSIFVETLEQRIAPAGLLNELKFTSGTIGGPILLDASDPNGFQGITTGTGGGSGSYLLYITAGKALVYTSDLNGDHRLESNEITGISAGLDSNGKPLDLISFTSIHGDIITNLLPGIGVSALTDSDNDPSNGRDGRVLLDIGIHSITLRTLTANDIDTSLTGNTVFNRLALTTYSIYGNIYTGGDFGGTDGGLTIDTTGSPQLALKFGGANSLQLYQGSDHPYVEGIYTGTAANNQHFTLNYGVGTTLVRGEIVPFVPTAGEHGGDITGVKGATPATLFDIDVIASGAGGADARGGNISGLVLHGDRGGYQILSGDGGSGATGGDGGSIVDFTDLGTVTSKVVIHTGNGGIGSLGAGGDGGTATFATTALAANLQIFLGSGGDGFNHGGNGDGLTDATIRVPEGPVPNGGTFIGTYHAPGDIGTTISTGNGKYVPQVVDFDGDGIGDAVVTTTGPDQIVVIFGDGFGGFSDNNGNVLSGPAKTVYLDAPGVVLQTVTIGDVNGDGKLDIIAASNSLDGAGGIYVFLNQIGDNVHNPLGNGTYQRNPLGDHVFSSPYITPIPTLVVQGEYDGVNPIEALASGDFNNDGIVDIGFVARYNNQVTQIVRNVLDIGFGAKDGYFYFNTNPDTTTAPQLHIASVGGGTEFHLQASAQNATLQGLKPSAPDLLFYAATGAKSVSVFSADIDPVTGLLTGFPAIAARKVDTNRQFGDPINVSEQDATIQDYAIADQNGDGFADVTMLTLSPGGFLVVVQGAAPPTGVGNVYTNYLSDFYDPVSGARLRDNEGIIATFNGQVSTDLLSIRPIDFNGDGHYDSVAMYDFGSPNPPVIRQFLFTTTHQDLTNAIILGRVPDPRGSALGNVVLLTPTVDRQIHGFDPYYIFTSDRVGNTSQITGYGAVSADLSDYRFADFEVASPIYNPFTNTFAGPVFFFYSQYETDNGIRIFAGSGGDSTTGAGGTGGILGNILSVAPNGDALGSIQIIFPAYASYFGEADLVGGNGGTGFAGGGAGGDVKGVSTRYTLEATILDSTVSLVGGNGGNGVIGDGGNGGSLFQFSLDTGRDLLGGNAGTGVHGGTGGNVLGNGTNGALFDLRANTYVTVVAGRGGVGSLQGGDGGRIDSFQPIFVSGGPLGYISGDGGSSAAGTGGNGGAIVNDSPDTNQNDLVIGITIVTGAGGSGLLGGSGGALTNFINQTTSSTGIPDSLDIQTGVGGIGIADNGGAGGAILNFQANGSGLTSGLVRVLAGNGGASYGGAGGVGGSITNTTAIAVSTPIVVAAGEGGDGLTVGGVGGSLDNDTINSAALNIGKVLAIAGAGGDASAALPTDIVIAGDPRTSDLAHAVLAFGGVSGIGGNGGNITRFRQPTSTQTAVDLIAGNGGSTLSYGTAISTTTNVGVGGSVDTANVAGTIGALQRDLNLNYNPPIKSYLDQTGNGTETGTLAGFIFDQISGTVDATQTPGPRALQLGFDSLSTLSNATGNVGIVAGVAGRVKDGIAARDGVNGSVQNITASSIMSIIAGSVDRVAPVQILSNINAVNLGGVLGADKSLLSDGLFGGPNGVVEYYTDSTGATIMSNLLPGYRLLDGALFAKTIEQPASGPQLAGPRIFTPGT